MVDDFKLGGLYQYKDFNTVSNRELIRPYPMVAKVIKIHSSENLDKFRHGLNQDLFNFILVDLLTSSGHVMQDVLMDPSKWIEL